MNKHYPKILKLSCIGGLSGIIYYILAGFSSYYTKNVPLIVDVIRGGIIFVIVGWGIIFSMVLLQPQLKDKKKLLFIGGGISGFIAGIFFLWGIALYVAFIILPVGLAITVNLAGLKSLSLKIIIGGLLGGGVGVVIGILLWFSTFAIQGIIPNLQSESIDVILATLNTMVIIYFLNLGILIGMKEGLRE